MSNEPLDEIQWKSPEWIQQFGLHSGNVLDYFSESPFYDRTSNNQVLKMQFQFQPPPNNISPHKYFEQKLNEMTGVEFTIAFNREPDFWIIRKQNRLNVESTIPLEDYYIIGANVYQAPKITDILSSRLLASVMSINNSIDILNKLAKFDIQHGGHTYISDSGIEKPAKTTSQGNTNNPSTMNTTTPITQTPQATVGTVGSTMMNNNNIASLNTEISNTAFDNMLNHIIQSNSTDNSTGDQIYLDDIPLYGKGSTVELLGLKVNLVNNETD